MALALRAVPSSFTVAPLMLGAVRSILMPLTEPSPTLPALSLMLTGPAPRLLPSPVTVLFAGCVARSMPDKRSWPVHLMSMLPLYQPAALGAVVAPPVTRVGLVLSILTGPYSVLLLLPATSTASPWTIWPAARVSFTSFAVAMQPATPLMPESASVQVNVTSTSVLFQPKSFWSGTGCR